MSVSSTTSLNALLEQHGLPPCPVLVEEPAREFSSDDLGRTINNRAYSLESTGGGRLFNCAALEEDPDEIGAMGTPLYSGILSTEPNPAHSPYQVRGYAGHHGTYEEYYRAEPILFEGVNEGNNLFTGGKIDFQAPDVPQSQKSAAEAFTEFCNRWWQRQWRGPHYLQKHMGWAKVFGFMVHEIVWGQDEKGRPFPRKIAMREPATVERWIMNPRADELAAVTFQLSGDAQATDGTSRYTLTATGPRLVDRKVLLVNINARGNNFEGVSLIRPAIHWIKFKQLLAQIAAVTAQKYGVPITVIFNALKDFKDGLEGADVGDVQQLHKIFSNLQAVNAPVFSVPDGLQVETRSPPGTMPALQEMILYADQMISKSLASEAGTLANGTVGSYAMAEVLDNRALRAQPGFASEVMMPINWLVADMARAMRVDLDEYPVGVWSMDGFADNSKWITDATQAMGGLPMTQWPPEMQKEASDKLNIPASTFDTEPPAPEAAGSVTVPGADLVGPEQNALADTLRELRGVRPANIYTLADAPKWSSGLNAKAALKQMEGAERKIARRYNSLAVEHQARWRELVRDGAGGLREDMDVIQREFLPRYEAVAREEMAAVGDSSGRQMLRDLGLTVTRKDPLPESPEMAMALDAVALSVALEAFNRQQGLMLDATARQETGDQRDGVPKLKIATFALVARRAVSIAFNSGRDGVAVRATEILDRDPTVESETAEAKVMAFRSSMLDSRVCPECRKRDFQVGSNPAVHVVGSKGYYDDFPPNHCEGGDRCRCVYVLQFPETARVGLEEMAKGEA